MPGRIMKINQETKITRAKETQTNGMMSIEIAIVIATNPTTIDLATIEISLIIGTEIIMTTDIVVINMKAIEIKTQLTITRGTKLSLLMKLTTSNILIDLSPTISYPLPIVLLLK